MAPIIDPLAAYVILPIGVFILVTFLWFFQSMVVHGLARRYIFPVLYRNKLTEWLVAQVSIVIHEVSHLISVLFTGSSVELKESFISTRSGRIAARSEESIFGWFSTVISAFSPAFLPPLLFVILFVLLLQQPLLLSDVFDFHGTYESFLGGLSESMSDVVVPNIFLLISVLAIPTLETLILLYLLIVCSIAAGPSEGDWRAAMKIIQSPKYAIPLLAAFLIFNYVFATFNLGFLVPVLTLVSFTFIVVILGLLVSYVFARLLKFIFGLGKRRL